MYKRPYIIAEAGCNHMGDMQVAHDMIVNASRVCHVNAIKFQKRCPRELLTDEQYNTPYLDSNISYGKTYGQHREFLEFTVEQHIQLKKWCEEERITYGVSVWDMTSAKEMVAINPEYIKIPSASNNNYDMLSWLCDNYTGEIQISLGMTTNDEERRIIELLEGKNRIHDVVLFSCTSGYPVAYTDVCLLEINRIREQYGKKMKDIGFSGHHVGTAIDIAAYTLGASIIERHYTLNHSWKGTDQAASLESKEMRLLVDNLNATYQALAMKITDVLPIEQIQREKLKYRKYQ